MFQVEQNICGNYDFVVLFGIEVDVLAMVPKKLCQET